MCVCHGLVIAAHSDMWTTRQESNAGLRGRPTRTHTLSHKHTHTQPAAGIGSVSKETGRCEIDWRSRRLTLLHIFTFALRLRRQCRFVVRLMRNICSASSVERRQIHPANLAAAPLCWRRKRQKGQCCVEGDKVEITQHIRHTRLGTHTLRSSSSHTNLWTWPPRTLLPHLNAQRGRQRNHGTWQEFKPRDNKQ